ncbi:hypothetical protein [Streptomyces malaysiensis]|uniref:hypothetical protein n=1 Tax=Streptomyces malaysiensis TaxID=92644 RepID=UPI000853C00A|nr:hypothetical protein [Streptomyces sp. SPMA113]
MNALPPQRTEHPATAPKAGSPTDVQVAVHAMASTAQDERRVRAHWTPERIAALNTPLSDNPPHDAADGARWKVARAAARASAISRPPRDTAPWSASARGPALWTPPARAAMTRGDPACVRHLVGPRFTTALTEPLHEKAQRLR